MSFCLSSTFSLQPTWDPHTILFRGDWTPKHIILWQFDWIPKGYGRFEQFCACFVLSLTKMGGNDPVIDTHLEGEQPYLWDLLTMVHGC